MVEKKLVELTTVPGRLTAEAILSYLQAFGVQGMISMEAIGSVYPLTVGELGEVQILIREEDYEKASVVLDDFYHESSSAELQADEDEMLGTGNLDDQDTGGNLS